MPEPEFMKAVKLGRVAHITIDHPPMNTIDTEILQQLAREVAKYEADDSVGVILLDSANQKPPFAADGAALLANHGWQKQFEMVREGSARSRRSNSPQSQLSWQSSTGFAWWWLGASAVLSYSSGW